MCSGGLVKVLAHISGVAAIIAVFLAVIARMFFADKSFLGLHALTYLRVTITMLLFTIAFLMYEVVRRGENRDGNL
jgi:hypothetical protein